MNPVAGPDDITPRAAPPSVDHFLLTRFSAVLYPGAPPAEPEWLSYRLGFFLDACHASVTSQEGAGPFTWLVLFDDRCPEWFRDAIEELAADGAFVPVWSHEVFTRDAFVPHVLARCRSARVITTRLDSDDAIAYDFMAVVQARLARAENLFCSFPRGVQIDRSGGVYATLETSAPFLSRIERPTPKAPLRTVFEPRHARARTVGPVLQVRSPAMWAQVLHDGNLLNRLLGRRVSPKVVNQRFRFALGYARHVPWPQLLVQKLARRLAIFRLLVEHPGEAFRRFEAIVVSLRGTYVQPQLDTDEYFRERLRRWAMRHGYRSRRYTVPTR